MSTRLPVRLTLSEYAALAHVEIASAIAHARTNERALGKFADPVDGEESDITDERAREIAREDANLVFITAEEMSVPFEHVMRPGEMTPEELTAMQAAVDTMEAAEAWMDDDGLVIRPSVTVRFALGNEAPGTYREREGRYQILGYTVSLPEPLVRLLDRAWLASQSVQ